MSERSDTVQRTVILTGASRGIGHATVKRFAHDGWRVITCSRQPFDQACPWDAGPENHIQIDLSCPQSPQFLIHIIRLFVSTICIPKSTVDRLLSMLIVCPFCCIAFLHWSSGSLTMPCNSSSTLSPTANALINCESYKEGRIPLHTLRADIDYGFAEALTTFGLIGIKVWVYNGEILSKDGEEDENKYSVKRS